MKMHTKVCFVPRCTNTSSDSPSKIFVSVPLNEERRRYWFTAVNLKLDKFTSGRHDMYCCEDHCNLENDALNWMFFKTIGKKLILKPNVVPHKFSCEAPLIDTVKSALSEDEKKRKADLLENFAKKLKTYLPEDYSEPSSSKSFGTSAFLPSTTVIHNMCSKISVGIQTNLKQPVRSKGVNTDEIKTHHVRTSPILFKSRNPESDQTKVKICVKSSSSNTVSESLSSSVTFSDCGQEDIHDSSTDLIDKDIVGMHLKESIPYENILITLKKIRIDDPYIRLASDFGVSISQVQRAFTDTVPKIANVLLNFIFWPDPSDVKKNVPLSFRARYSNVQSIIDCFEVEIEKPSNPVIQASTWSDYKGCNTVKFLLSCTPSGYINFISKAYAGRISDTEIVKISTYLEELPTNASVLADRGFKHVATLLKEKSCDLIRPPSVSAQVESTAQEVRESKIIASLRIHVERVIRRIREFSILQPHSCVHHSLVELLSHIVVIVCGL